MTRGQLSARNVLDRAMSEDELLTAITEALTLYGWLWTHPRRSDKALTMGHPGVPDIIAVRRGRVKFIELKKHGEQPTQEQWRWLHETEPVSRAIAWHIWRPDDLDAALVELM